MKKALYSLILFLGVLTGCSDDGPEATVVTSGDVSDITASSATIAVEINFDREVPKMGIWYGTDNSLIEYKEKYDLNTANKITFNIDGLSPSTTYYYRAFAVDGHNSIIYGQIRNFTTNAEAVTEETLVLSESSLSFAAAASNKTVSITSNTTWTVSSNQTWCTVSPTSGSNNGTVTFNVAANTTTAQRTATITVTAGAQTRTVSVVQAGQTASSENIVFADAKFKSYCVSNFDTNLDGEISKTEAANVTIIKVSGTYFNNNNITSLQGIEFFTALTTLWCHYNQLTQLDVSKNTALTQLACGCNQLTQLDVSKNTALDNLNCYGNQLTQLDVSKNTALTRLACGGNQLTQLDVSKNTALTYLSCVNNQLTQLDVSKNTALSTLYCDHNPNLTKLYLKTGQTINDFNKDGQTQIIYK